MKYPKSIDAVPGGVNIVCTDSTVLFLHFEIIQKLLGYSTSLTTENFMCKIKVKTKNGNTYEFSKDAQGIYVNGDQMPLSFLPKLISYLSNEEILPAASGCVPCGGNNARS